jgi:hypothetical protein
MTAEEITSEYPKSPWPAYVRPPPAAPRWHTKICSPCHSHSEVQARREPACLVAAILASAGHDVDTVTEEGLIGAPDRDAVAAATAAGRVLICLDARGATSAPMTNNIKTITVRAQCQVVYRHAQPGATLTDIPVPGHRQPQTSGCGISATSPSPVTAVPGHGLRPVADGKGTWRCR